MRIVVIADLHSNLAAFEAILEDAGRGGTIDAIWALGDIVGYGPDPGACLELLQSYPHHAVAGNHDLAAAGLLSVEDFRPPAASAALWTGEQLTEAQRQYIVALPLSYTEGDFTLAHGTLTDPVWEYLVAEDAAEAHFKLQTTHFAFVGHSHIPLIFTELEPPLGEGLSDGVKLPLDREALRWVANPGGAGQPRDGDPRTAYALVDLDARTVLFRRVPYDIADTQAKMRAAGLPQPLIDRLALGR